MKWLSNVKSFFVSPHPIKHIDNKEGVDQATRYLESAKTAVAEARDRKVETRKVSSSLIELNGLNHYGESIFLAMMPREKRFQ